MAAFFIGIASLAHAHDPGLSTAVWKIFPDRLEAEVIFARADVESLVPLDANHDERVSPEEWASVQPQLEALAREALNVVANGTAIAVVDLDFHLDEANNVRLTGIVPAQGVKALKIESPLIKQLPRGHRQFVTLLDDQGVTLAEALLSAEHNMIEFEAPEARAEEVQTASTATFREFVIMGVEHVLTGYDHLLFLFGLLIAMSQFRATLWVITCFTIAHSTTLALAAFDVVRISGQIVEPLIAATIIYVGAENLLSSQGSAGRWRLALVFGLVHGLGFASVLREKLAGMIGAKIAIPLLSFNLGVELGQLAVAALMLPVILGVRSQPVFIRHSVPVCSALVVLAGAWWLLQRTLLA